MELSCQCEMRNTWLVLLALAILMFPEGCLAQWQPATVTWYGSPEGDGSTGGACGYKDLVDSAPIKGRATAASPSVWGDGKSCGACYQVKCTIPGICTGKPVTVIITDECPGCSSTGALFDLSGSAFGAMAVPGQAQALRNKGRLPVSYQRTQCIYPGTPITFQVNQDSTQLFFSILIKYEGGDGDIGAVQLQQQGSPTWMDMKHLWGANWSLTGAGQLKAPFSLRVTSLTTRKSIIKMNVIPKNWKPNASYS